MSIIFMRFIKIMPCARADFLHLPGKEKADTGEIPASAATDHL